MAGTLAVGFFDGVHLGHHFILSGADEALTFSNHPLSVLAPECAPRLIMTLADRLEAIRACGVEKVTVLDFTRELADVSPADFAATYLLDRRIRCGANWRFGKGGAGDAAFLRSLGYDVSVVPAVSVDAMSSSRQKIEISSTRIRAALESGRIGEANAMLGRPFFVHGVPFKGKGKGHSLGYPTVNLRLQEFALRLPLGVYSVEVDGSWGIANYGHAPTFGTQSWSEPVLEIHFTDALPSDVDSSRPKTVRFRQFIRPERKFASVNELKAQIASDIQLCACGVSVV